MSHKIWGTAKATLSPTSLSALRLKYLLSDLTFKKYKNVLEVGSGAGMFVRAVKTYRPDLFVSGVDVDSSAIKSARKISKDLKYKVGSLYKLPYKNQEFDAIFSFDVFEHLEEPEKAMSEVARVLKKNGLFHLYVPCEGNLYTIYGIAKLFGFIPKKRFAGHIQQYKTPELVSIARRHGFEVKNIRYSSHYINQFVDFLYFCVLTIMNKETSRTIEGYIAGGKESLWSQLLKFVKDQMARVFYYESLLFSRVPAHGVHLTLKRK